MGDGIVNQHMREDLENWLSTLGLDPNAPVNVIGYFGQTRDLSIFERVQPCIDDDCTELSQGEESVAYEDMTPSFVYKGSDLSGYRLPVYVESDQDTDEDEQEGTRLSENSTGMSLGIGDQRTGDIAIYVDRISNTLTLQHSYLYDSQEMLSICHESIAAIGKDKASLTKWLYSQEFESHRALLFLFLVSQVIVYTSTELTIDPRIISILLALSTTKRQIMQELDRFMTICWDRIGVTSPDQRKHLENGGHHSGNRNGGPGNSSGAPAAQNIFTPGKCVPVLVFVVERVPITAPWFDAGASEAQIMDQLRHQLKKSIDALQTRLRYVFKACRLLQSIDSPGNAFDGRQLFVLPAPSSTPFVHVVPYFTGILNLPQRVSTPEIHSGEVLDPAEAVLRQKKAGNGPKRQQQQLGTKGRDKEKTRGSQRGQQQYQQEQQPKQKQQQTNSFGMPSLEEVYSAIVQAKDQSLAEPNLGMELDDPLTLTSIYMDYTGPLLRQFLDGWIKATTAPGGYGSIIGKRSIGHLEMPTLEQWLAGYLGVCEGLGISSLVPRSNTNRNSVGPGSSGDESLSSKLAKVSVSGGSGDPKSSNNNGREGREGRESGGGRRSGGKRYSQRSSNMVQKKIRDFVQSDEVMEELRTKQLSCSNPWHTDDEQKKDKNPPNNDNN
ncbi:hypothetical protein BGZ93_002992 [Podila epicladia]|nr:hypothetical protein BGZ92_002189 [Podila epicladia]KAG0097327.1 hypothetical protein BGZ93_002992 [Podila epicladia]